MVSRPEVPLQKSTQLNQRQSCSGRPPAFCSKPLQMRFCTHHGKLASQCKVCLHSFAGLPCACGKGSAEAPSATPSVWIDIVPENAKRGRGLKGRLLCTGFPILVFCMLIAAGHSPGQIISQVLVVLTICHHWWPNMLLSI